MTEVTLSWAEMLVAANVGVMRNVQCMKQGRGQGQRHTISGLDPWGVNIEGAAGEMAVAKYLGTFWSGALGDFDAKDVGRYQVKTNTSRKWDHLIIRDWNPRDGIYIGVLSFMPRYVITGWISGEDGMKQEFFRDGLPGVPAYFVPRAALRPLSELPRFEKEHAAA